MEFIVEIPDEVIDDAYDGWDEAAEDIAQMLGEMLACNVSVKLQKDGHSNCHE